MLESPILSTLGCGLHHGGASHGVIKRHGRGNGKIFFPFPLHRSPGVLQVSLDIYSWQKLEETKGKELVKKRG